MPRRLEIELAKFLGTIGFADYGKALWDMPPPPAEEKPAEEVAPAIVRQIHEQARHDPSVLAAGPAAVPHLPRATRTAFYCWGVTAADLLAAARPRPSVLLVVARLDLETLDRVAPVLQGLRQSGAGDTLIVVTDQRGDDVAVDVSVPPPAARLLFWRDHFSGDGAFEPRLFAMFVHAVGAPVMISFSTRLGLETLDRYGRALRRFHSLFAILDNPRDDDKRLFKDMHYLRSAAPCATFLASSEEEAALLKTHGREVVGLQVETLASGFWSDSGLSFEDRRSATSRRVISALLTGPKPEVAPANQAPRAHPFDITVTIVFHREGALADPALASLADMIEVARRGGLKIEARAMLDRADEATRHVVERRGAFLDDVREVSFGDLGLTRNAGTALAQGAYLAFFDGDDLWGADWLLQSFRAAKDATAPATAIWHPATYFLFRASDCGWSSDTSVPHPRARSSFFDHPSSADRHFDTRELLLENLWTANAFALADVFRRFPYRANDWAEQAGIEDWRWNLETLGAGVPHLVVPETVHLVREKEGGSLGQRSDALGLLPILP